MRRASPRWRNGVRGPAARRGRRALISSRRPNGSMASCSPHSKRSWPGQATRSASVPRRSTRSCSGGLRGHTNSDPVPDLGAYPRVLAWDEKEADRWGEKGTLAPFPESTPFAAHVLEIARDRYAPFVLGNARAGLGREGIRDRDLRRAGQLPGTPLPRAVPSHAPGAHPRPPGARRAHHRERLARRSRPRSLLPPLSIRREQRALIRRSSWASRIFRHGGRGRLPQRRIRLEVA